MRAILLAILLVGCGRPLSQGQTDGGSGLDGDTPGTGDDSVTFRLNNVGTRPLYAPHGFTQFGLYFAGELVARSSGCSTTCDTCGTMFCSSPMPGVRRLAPGASLTEKWSGSVYEHHTCGPEPRDCLSLGTTIAGQYELTAEYGDAYTGEVSTNGDFIVGASLSNRTTASTTFTYPGTATVDINIQ